MHFILVVLLVLFAFALQGVMTTRVTIALTKGGGGVNGAHTLFDVTKRLTTSMLGGVFPNPLFHMPPKMVPKSTPPSMTSENVHVNPVFSRKPSQAYELLS